MGELISGNIFTDILTIGSVRPRSRRRCHCGCKRRATHNLKANGIVMAEGCEFSIWRWRKELWRRRPTTTEGKRNE